MCGISGILSRNTIDTFDVETINAILIIQENRGPDFKKFIKYDNYISGHNRLKIVDLSESGNQPMESSKYNLVFNGEIYNYLELRNFLKDFTTFNSKSDTEVLLKMFELFGIENTLKKINGMFSIALYDKIEKRLFLIRDRLGEKPLYYYNDIDNGKFYFASNLKSIFYSLYKIKNKKWYVNYDSIYKFLLLGGCWEGESLVKNIYKMESASYLDICFDDKSNNFNITQKIYWKPTKRESSITELHNLIKNSVELRLHSDVNTSILFSGGIDSSVLAYFAPKSLCIHLCNGESDYAEKIAKKLDVVLKKIDSDEKKISVDKLYNYLKEYINFSGEPSMACIIPMLTLDGVKEYSTVLLSGNGGDELCFGYNRTPVLIKDNKINKKVCEQLKNNNLIYDINNKKNYDDLDFQLLHIFRHPEKFKVKNAKQFSYNEFKNFIYSQVKIDEKFDKEAFLRYLEFNNYIKNDLNPTLDYSSMYYGIEVRCPFLDHCVVEQALSITSQEHISDNSNNNWEFCRKDLLKKILSNKLEEDLYNRTKLGFSLPSKLSNEYRIIMGEENINKLKKRNIIEIFDENLGIKDRDIAYLRASCTALEEWFVQYVDTKIINL